MSAYDASSADLNRRIDGWQYPRSRYVIQKGGHYYREYAQGYTDLKRAWRVSLEVAKDHEYCPKGCTDPVTIEKAPAEDYCEDLNAIQSAVALLDEDLINRYADRLYADRECRGWTWDRAMLCSKPRARAEALVTVLGL